VTGRLRHLLRDLAGRNDDRFVTLLCQQVGCALRTTQLIRLAVGPDGAAEGLLEAVKETEHRADGYRDALIEELGVALTTPLDREDLFRLSRSLDDIVDNLRDFVDALTLFDVADMAPATNALATLEDGLGGLGDAVELLREGPASVTRAARATKRATRVRQAYLEGLVDVFAGEDVIDMLKQRELLRRLDVVGLRFGEAADVLADAALKRV
jgi:uncharacterized protein